MLPSASPRLAYLVATFVGVGVATVVSLAGCQEPALVFTCQTSAQCASITGAGVCEATGSCSFADPVCPSGRRYGALSAQARARQCTECGNGKVDPGEECDDGNQKTNDACLPTCRWNVCGDGFVRDAVEECDDGNRNNGDACSDSCLRCATGDAHFLWSDNGHCYTRTTAAQSWDGAQQACSLRGAHLAAYNSEVEQVAVRAALLTGVPDPHWIGLRDLTGAAAYGWITGEPVVSPMRDFGPPFPAAECAANQDRAGAWNYLGCATLHGSLCEDPGWVIEPKHHHAYRAFYNQPSWGMARDVCPHWGGHLATIEDADEQQFITAQFFGTFWLGANKSGTGTPPAFAWITGEPFTFTAFADGEPDAGASASCLAVGGDRRWHDRPCDGSWKPPYGFICEVE